MTGYRWARIFITGLLILTLVGCAAQGEVNGGGTIVGNPAIPYLPEEPDKTVLAEDDESSLSLRLILKDLPFQLLFPMDSILKACPTEKADTNKYQNEYKADR